MITRRPGTPAKTLEPACGSQEPVFPDYHQEGKIMRACKTLLSAGLLSLALAAPAQADPEAAITKAGCTACHAKDKKLVGPSYKQIAAKHKGKADAAKLLFDHARQGSRGVYGPVPMPPNPPAKISDADLQAVVAWILQQ
jgi:cytochrome c